MAKKNIGIASILLLILLIGIGIGISISGPARNLISRLEPNLVAPNRLDADLSTLLPPLTLSARTGLLEKRDVLLAVDVRGDLLAVQDLDLNLDLNRSEVDLLLDLS